METPPDPPEAAATTVTSPDTDTLRSTVTPPDVPMLVLPLLCWRIGPTPVRVGALPMARAAPTDELSLLLLALAVGGPVCSDVPEPGVSGLAVPPDPFLLPREPVCGI